MDSACATVGANSRHIVIRSKSAFLAIRALKEGLRFGLRLETIEADRHTRLEVQPRGTFEGWSALHVSTRLSQLAEIDDELVELIKRAALSAS